MTEAAAQQVIVGRVTGIFGVKGWVRVFSYTDPPAKILDYGPWLIGESAVAPHRVTDGAVHGRGIVAHLEGLDDRDVARGLIGSTIRVPRARFDRPGRDEYYWFDLLGLEVINEDGKPLGRVEELLATGANDVLVVRGERRRLVPFVPGDVVKSVDLDAGVINVSWDMDF